MNRKMLAAPAIMVISLSGCTAIAGVTGGNSTGYATSSMVQPSYADLADGYADAPIVIRAKVRSVAAIPDAATMPGTARFYVEADVLNLIRGAEGVPPRINYLVDLPIDSHGKPPRLNKAIVLIGARAVPGRADSVQVLGKGSHRIADSALESRVRTIVSDSAATGAVPRITGISSAFHSAGTVPGEGETQIFLTTATGNPVSLSVRRQPSADPKWVFANGEIVDESAITPVRDTLAWYRLACALPAALPASATAELSADDAAAARADYALVIAGLGPCGRTG